MDIWRPLAIISVDGHR